MPDSRIVGWLRLQARRLNWLSYELLAVIGGHGARNPYGTPDRRKRENVMLRRDDGWPR